VHGLNGEDAKKAAKDRMEQTVRALPVRDTRFTLVSRTVMNRRTEWRSRRRAASSLTPLENESRGLLAAIDNYYYERLALVARRTLLHVPHRGGGLGTHSGCKRSQYQSQ
jgi:hypothetical protein